MPTTAPMPLDGTKTPLEASKHPNPVLAAAIADKETLARIYLILVPTKQESQDE